MSLELIELKKNFRIIVERIFNNWQNLRLAVEHGMGGRDGQKVAIQIMDYMYEYCIGNDKIAPSELQEVLEDLMDQEFNTLCDDSSIEEICRNLLRFKDLCVSNQYTLIESELSKLPQGKDWLRPDVKITFTPVAGEESSDDDDDASCSETEDMDIDEEAACSRVTRSQARDKQTDNFVEPEPGWTTVRTKKK